MTAKTKTAAKRTRKPTANTVSVNMSEALAENVESANPSLLDSILADLNAEDSEVIEPTVATVEADPSVIEEAMEVAAAITEDEERAASQPEGDRPMTVSSLLTGADDDATVDETKVKAKRTRKPAAEKPEGEAKTPRVTYHGNRRSTVLADRLGGDIKSWLVLEQSDAALDSDALTIKQAELLEQFDTVLAKKVAEKAVMLLRDLSKGQPTGNDVMKTAFTVLARDGFLTSGDKGNLQGELRKKLSLGTARSQANQMFMMMPFLKLTVKSEKGKMEPNPESVLLPMINGNLGL